MELTSLMSPASSSRPPAGLAVQLRGVRRRFSTGTLAVDGLDLSIPSGQFIALLGPSGCGKSTLLKIIAGLDRADAGSVRLDDDTPASASSEKARREIAYVFQDAHLLPWRNVLHNAALPLELMGVDRPARQAAAREALSLVGLGDSFKRYPAELSGGMRMRVSLARALVSNPRLLLLDEPFAALDEITRQQLDEQLRQLWKTRGMTVIFVTHSIQEAAYLAQRAVVLSRRPARLVLDHPVDLPAERPAALRAEPAFARQMHALFQALQRGQEMP